MKGSTSLSGVMAKQLPEADEEQQKEEYFAILTIFKRLLESISDDANQWEVLEELMELRATFAIHHAIRGFGMDYEKALEIVRNYKENLSDEEKEQRIILVAAIDNLVDFAVAEEYQMVEELPDIDEDPNEEELEELLDICYKYNFRYANVENMDIEYAMIVAAGLVGIASRTMLTYMTQGDERVRPWHLQFEGFSAPKSEFPAWLIPPIEYQCRCYLITEEILAKLTNVLGNKAKFPEMPEWFNPVFKESVALGGRIFSDEHRYFDIPEQHQDRLHIMSLRIKNKFLVDGE